MTFQSFLIAWGSFKKIRHFLKVHFVYHFKALWTFQVLLNVLYYFRKLVYPRTYSEVFWLLNFSWNLHTLYKNFNLFWPIPYLSVGSIQSFRHFRKVSVSVWFQVNFNKKILWMIFTRWTSFRACKTNYYASRRITKFHKIGELFEEFFQ